jgi:DNA-directed RNA polymerase subunit beta'
MMEGDPKKARFAFGSTEEALGKYHQDEVTLYEPIKVLINNEIITTTVGRILLNEGLPEQFRFVNETLSKKLIQEISGKIFALLGPDVAVQTLDAIKDLGFRYATISGFSVGMEDFEFESDEMVTRELKEFDIKESELIKLYYEGMISEEELKRLKQEVWLDAAEGIQETTWDLASKSASNMIHLNSSGATPVASWIKSIAGVRGVVVDPLGRIVDLPLRNNYKNGLNNFEYFVAARGTRKSFTDVALRTADSGYLTRKLVDVSQDVIIRSHDCGSTEGIYLVKSTKRNLSYVDQLKSRYAAEDLVDPKTGELIVANNAHISIDIAERINNIDAIEKVKVRSPLTCKYSHGLCTMCYGIDYSTGRPIEMGMAVGVIAAQALGEPTTQLTLKNKSDARANKADVTQGLPRVQELIEVRTPKAKAIIAEMSGEVKIIENDKDVTIRLTSVKKMKKTYAIESGDEVMVKRGRSVKENEVLIVRANKEEVRAIHEGKIEIADDKLMLLIDKEYEAEYVTDHASDAIVKDGEFVEAGKQLTFGSIYPKELVAILGVQAAQKYIIDELQLVYGIQGIAMDDKHLEIIVRQMSRYAQITDSGDGMDVLPGDFVDMLDVDRQNEELKAAGKRQVQYTRPILGITNAALRTESFLSAASFQEQVRVLTEAALIGKTDLLRGLKENVIIGRPVPLGKYAREYVGEED